MITFVPELQYNPACIGLDRLDQSDTSERLYLLHRSQKGS